ncbi:hypothetical protein MTO96_013571 [Rhipicephalus appendiculatus]
MCLAFSTRYERTSCIKPRRLRHLATTAAGHLSPFLPTNAATAVPGKRPLGNPTVQGVPIAGRTTTRRVTHVAGTRREIRAQSKGLTSSTVTGPIASHEKRTFSVCIRGQK